MTAPGREARAMPSLRSRLSRHLLVPLALTWLLGSLVALEVAQYFTGRAFDRSLLDDAYMVASNVRVDGNGLLRLDMSPREMQGVLFDQTEAMLLNVVTPDGAPIAGNTTLQPELPDDDARYDFHNATVGGRTVRVVTLRRDQPAPFYVVVAQTNRSRTAMLRAVLLYATVPQIALLAGLALWLRRAIDRDTEALARLQQVVDQRSEADLAPVEVNATTRDVERLGGAINSLLARLSRSLAAQREFAGNVAHELRTPLAGIRALAAYGLAQKDDPQVWRAQLERIAGSEARASRLVDQLLALALADEVRAGLALEPVALDEVVQGAVLRFLPRADAAGVDLGARGAEEPVQVRAHPLLLEGIVNNLIDNALRYARPPAGEAPTITVGIAQDASGTVLSVSDNGPGMPAEAVEQLSRRWAQGDAGQLLGQGVGLGLGIVSQYAQLMGARLSFAPGADGRGLVASVRFAAPQA